MTILNSEGVSRFVMEDVRFSSGESIRTGDGSMASVGLDDTKIVTLDSGTLVQFIQEDQHMRLNLAEGTLFLDVQQSLDENEGLDIQTTTMTVGIRGTIVFASSTPDPDGQKVSILQPEGESAAAPVVTPLTREDISGFVADVVASDPAIQERITELPPPAGETADNAFPADGDWVWSEPVTLVAQSASKLYDGLPLTRPSNALVYGLPAGFSINVTVSGSRTDAGSTVNTVSSWEIRNPVGEVVTFHFTNVETVDGALVVERAPLFVWTGSAEKVYDGTPLTMPDAEIHTVDGYTARNKGTVLFVSIHET